MTAYNDYDCYRQKALALGSSDAVILSPEEIIVEPELARLCEGEKCPGFGQGANCPPYSMTPGRFIEILSKSSAALVFRIVVPSELLYSSDRHEIAGFIHQTAAEIERYAISKGDPAIGFAGGACKEIFCREFEDCHVIHHQKKCRFGEHSRNSMSGLGVNFNKLNEIPGWNNHTKKGGEKTATGMMAGMVLFL